MAVGRARRAATAVVTAVAAVALAVAVYGRGCTEDSGSARSAARQFLAASRAGDAEAMFELLSEATRQQLALAAERANELVGGARRFTATDMINPPVVDPGAPPEPLVLIEDGDERVVFQVRSGAGDEPGELVLIREGEDWRVDVPGYRADVPAAQP